MAAVLSLPSTPGLVPRAGRSGRSAGARRPHPTRVGAQPPNRRGLPAASVRRRGTRARARGGGGPGECGARRVLPCPRRAPPAGHLRGRRTRRHVVVDRRRGRARRRSPRGRRRARRRARHRPGAAGRDDHLARPVTVTVHASRAGHDEAEQPERYGGSVRCPYCRENDDKVVDSRVADDGGAIRRRRECLACGRRYTTYERVEEVGLLVRKRSGEIEPFDRAKLRAGVERAATNRLDTATVDAIVGEVEEELRTQGGEVRQRTGRPGGPRAAPQPRPRRLPAVRVGLQGLRGPRRLRARGRRAPEDDRTQAAVGGGASGLGRSLVHTCTNANLREPPPTRMFADPESVDAGVTTVL